MRFIQGNIRPSEGISCSLCRITDPSSFGEGKGKGRHKSQTPLSESCNDSLNILSWASALVQGQSSRIIYNKWNSTGGIRHFDETMHTVPDT
jgi:hypothetical protein